MRVPKNKGQDILKALQVAYDAMPIIITLKGMVGIIRKSKTLIKILDEANI